MSASSDGSDWHDLFAAFAAATRRGDADGVAALCEPDALMWHNFDEASVSVAESGRTLRWLHRTVPDVTWTDVAVTRTEDGFVWRAVITGNAPGGAIRAHTCMIVTVSPAGNVARVDEYIDPAQMAALTG